MRPHRSLPAMLSLVLGIAFVGAPRIALATSYDCWPVPARVFNSAAIVVGRGLAPEKEETRPGVYTITYRFQIEEVLKGDLYKDGDTITKVSTPRWLGMGGPILPTDVWGDVVVFLNKGSDGILWVNPCSIPLDSPNPAVRANLPEIRRMIKVAASPKEYLDSTDSLDVSVILTWIGRNYARQWGLGGDRVSSDLELEQDRDTVISYLVSHARDETIVHSMPGKTTGSLALSILGQFCEEEHYDLLMGGAEGYNGAHIGVMCIEAKREVSGLLERLRELRRVRWSELEQLPADERQAELWPDDEYTNTIAELVKALKTANDRETGRAFVKELQERYAGTSDVGVQLGDEAHLVSILRPTWTGPRRGKSPRIFDPEAIREARQNIYDDPKAVGLLAAKEDEQVADFMIRLLRQGHGSGGAWAATVQDRSLIPDLLAAFEHAQLTHAWSLAAALGRMRVWKAIELLQNMDGDRRHGAQISFLAAICDVPQYWSEPAERSPSPKRLRKLADSEGWPEGIYESLVQLSQELKTGTVPGGKTLYRVFDTSIPWVPPDDLPDMPDPLAKDEAWEFLSGNEGRVASVLRTGSATDKCKVLHAAARSKAWIDHDTLGMLMRDESSDVRTASVLYLRKLNAEPDFEQVRLWALHGSPDMTTRALRYITEKADKSHASIVEAVYRGGWHLFDAQLFRAIMATKARGCIYDRPGKAAGLRSYLNGHHPTLRCWAAVTLATLGDGGGSGGSSSIIEVLKAIQGHSSDWNYEPTPSEVSHALFVIDPQRSYLRPHPPIAGVYTWLRDKAVAVGVAMSVMALIWRTERHRSQQRRAGTLE